MRPRAADSRPYERAVRRLAPIRQLLCEKENLPHPCQMGISACCAATCTAFPAPGPSRRTAGRRMVSAPAPHFCRAGAHSMRPQAADSRPCERAVQTLAPIRQLLCKKENLPRPCQMGTPACCAATCTAFPAPGLSRRTADGRMVSAPAPTPAAVQGRISCAHGRLIAAPTKGRCGGWPRFGSFFAKRRTCRIPARWGYPRAVPPRAPPSLRQAPLAAPQTGGWYPPLRHISAM